MRRPSILTLLTFPAIASCITLDTKLWDSPPKMELMIANSDDSRWSVETSGGASVAVDPGDSALLTLDRPDTGAMGFAAEHAGDLHLIYGTCHLTRASAERVWVEIGADGQMHCGRGWAADTTALQ